MAEIDTLDAPPIQPVWRLGAEHPAIIFGTYECTVEIEQQSVDLPLELVLENRDRPRLVLKSRSGVAPTGLLGSLFGDENRHWLVQLKDGGKPFDVFPTWSQSNEKGISFDLSPSKSAVRIRYADSGLQSGTFHLINFPRLFGGDKRFAQLLGEKGSKGHRACGHVEFVYAGYRISIVNTPEVKHDLDKTVAGGGYAITAVGKVERVDEGEFSSAEFDSILSKLHCYLSFALGRWSGVCLPVGIDREGKRLHEEWGVRLHSAGLRATSQSWFYEGNAQVLADAASGFFDLLDREVWKDELHRALWWYLAANNRGESVTCDMAIVHAHAALESLAWLYCVQDRGMVSAEAFKPGKLRASDKIRLLCKSVGVPTDIPSSLDDLSRLTPKPFVDAPHAIAELRNEAIHPEKGKELNCDPWYDCLQLALWQIELVVLSLAGYQGRYASRLGRGFVGNHEPVPWAT